MDTSGLSGSKMGMGMEIGRKLQVKIEVLVAGPVLQSISRRSYIASASTLIQGSASSSASADSTDPTSLKQRESTPPVALAHNAQETMATSAQRGTGTDWGVHQAFVSIGKSPSESTLMNYVPLNLNHAASFSSASEAPAVYSGGGISATAEKPGPGPEPLQKKIRLEETQETSNTPHKSQLTD